jgi:hypothetical protein
MSSSTIYTRYFLLQCGIDITAFKTIQETKNHADKSINSSSIYKIGEYFGSIYEFNDGYHFGFPGCSSAAAWPGFKRVDDYYVTKLQLAKNFKLNEFSKLPLKSLNSRTIDQLHAIAKLLQAIRDKIGKPITVTSGVRTEEDFNRLLKNGNNPSPTSDHYYGNIVSCAAGSVAFNKYGVTYSLATGAADIVCLSMETVDFFNKILKMRYDGVIKTGQLLIEKNKTMMWVHIANHPDSWLTDEQKKLRGDYSIAGVAYSSDNGKNFTSIKSGLYAPRDLK